MALNTTQLNGASPFTSKAKITELPQELLEEILEGVDIDTTLSLRSTCKALLAATDSHRAWRALVRQLQEYPHISPPEEPLQDYTMEELRDWVTRRHGIQCVLKSLRTPTLRIRKLDTPLPITYLGMIPGGRWLLLGDTVGNLKVVDCEANQLELKPFIRDEYGKKDQKSIFAPTPLNFWIDQAEPRLTFIIALQRSIEQTAESPHRGNFRLRIYRVRLTGHGDMATLEAGFPLQEIWGKWFGCLGPNTLNDHYFIQLESFDPYNHYMRVYHYDSCISSPPPPPITVFLAYIADPVYVLCILPGDRVAIITETSVVIYAIPTPKEVDEARWMPLFRTKLPMKTSVDIGPVEMVPPPYFGELSTVISYPGRSAIMRVVIPNDILEELTITKMAELD